MQFQSFKELANHFNIDSSVIENKQHIQDHKDHQRFYTELDNSYRVNPDPLMESRNPKVKMIPMGAPTQETNGLVVFGGLVTKLGNRYVGTSDTTWIDKRHQLFVESRSK